VTGLIADGILNYLVLSGGFDVSRFDPRRLVDLRSGQYRRFNATYTHNTACSHRPCFEPGDEPGLPCPL